MLEMILKLLGYLSPVLVILLAQLFKKIFSALQKFAYWNQLKPILVILAGVFVEAILKAWNNEITGNAIAELQKLLGDSGFIILVAMVIYRLFKVIIKNK